MLKINERNNERHVEVNLNRTSHIPLHTSQRGITLIALIITIIIMLILVAVTITVAVNGGLFNYAGKAAKETNEAIENEKALANGEIEIGDEKTTIREYVDSIIDKKEIFEFTIIGWDDEGKEVNLVFTAEKGMTWRTWFESEYPWENALVKENDFEVMSWEDGDFLYFKDCGLSGEPGGDYDLIDTLIIEGKTYWPC